MKAKYGALRTISVIYKVLAITVLVLSLVVAVVGLLLIFGSSGGSGTLVTTVTWLAGGSILAVSMYATGELFDLLIEMEENTRASRLLLYRMAQVFARGATGAGQRSVPPPSSPALDVGDALPDIDEL